MRNHPGGILSLRIALKLLVMGRQFFKMGDNSHSMWQVINFPSAFTVILLVFFFTNNWQFYTDTNTSLFILPELTLILLRHQFI